MPRPLEGDGCIVMFRSVENNFGVAKGAFDAPRILGTIVFAHRVMHSCWFGPALALVLCTTGAHAQDARRLAAGCSACHGTNGVSVAGPRSLAGMQQEEIARALRAFKAGERSGTVMPQLAKGYTDDEIDALAAWFATRRPPR